VIADRDPFVAQALDLLVPDFDFDPETLLSGARARAASVRGARRRRRTIVAVAFAVLLLFAGAAIAADRFDLLPFLHTNDKNSARFAVSRKGAYRGAAPVALTCPGAGKGTFACNVTGAMTQGTRNYQFGWRVDRVPSLTRQSMNAALDKAAANGGDPAQIARARSDLAAVGDDFIRALGVMVRIQTVSSSSGPSANGTERVPPRGVPAWVACREVTLTTARCRPLAALVGVKTGTPLYSLQPSEDWRTVQAPPSDHQDIGGLMEKLLGRKPTAAEERFFIDLATVGTSSGSGPAPKSGHSGPTSGAITASSNARMMAKLAPHSLGVATRNVSAVELPLPHGRLPVGLTHSARTRLYRVTFDLLRTVGADKAGRHTIYVYLTHHGTLGVWEIARVGANP
jgi:hypothetical protein